MSKFGLLTQVGMIMIAVAIGMLYIRPSVVTIRETEDSVKLYQREVDNVSAVNQDLAGKIAAIDALPTADTQALLTYLPDSVDEIAVMKDILAILSQNNAATPDVVAKNTAPTSALSAEEPAPDTLVVPYDFEVKFKTTYPDLLKILSAFEGNNYLLQVTELKVVPAATGELDVSMRLTAFSLGALRKAAPELDVTQE